MKKLFLSLLLLAGMALGAQAQTVATVAYADGSSHEYAIDASGGFYFDSAVLIIRESRIADEVRIAVDDIQRINLRRQEEGPVAIDEMEQGTMRLFPNPATQQVQIVLPDEESHLLSIYSIGGQLVKQCTVRNGETLSVAELPRGVYMARTEQHIVKLIKR